MPYSSSHERIINAPQAEVFACFADWGGVQQYLPDKLEKVETNGPVGIGAERSNYFFGMDEPAVERIDILLEPYLLSYSIVNKPDLPLEMYRGVVQVEALTPDRCHLTWSSNWYPADGMSKEEVNELVLGFYIPQTENIANAAEERAAAAK